MILKIRGRLMPRVYFLGIRVFNTSSFPTTPAKMPFESMTGMVWIFLSTMRPATTSMSVSGVTVTGLMVIACSTFVAAILAISFSMCLEEINGIMPSSMMKKEGRGSFFCWDMRSSLHRMPTKFPSLSSTGAPLMWLSMRILAASTMPISCERVITLLVMISLTFMPLSPVGCLLLI